jgi:hypothetical protein
MGSCRNPVNLNITSRGCHFMTFCDFRKKSAKKNLKSLVQIRIKALNVKKGCPTKAGRFYL